MIKKPKNEFQMLILLNVTGKIYFKDNYFDLVVLSEVLFYMSNPIHCLLEVYRVLKPGKI